MLTPDVAVDLVSESLRLVMLLVVVLVLPGLLIGLLVGLFQAATQINEATLSFVPKIVAAVLVMAVAGPWMVTTLVEYIQRTLQSIPGAIG